MRKTTTVTEYNEQGDISKVTETIEDDNPAEYETTMVGDTSVSTPVRYGEVAYGDDFYRYEPKSDFFKYEYPNLRS